ncbi:MAG TPA: amphi-Trp domain-containing protein [Bacillota bacterium]|nr:amphi-Trp domain-containing protein [Bacillota bacterium]
MTNRNKHSKIVHVDYEEKMSLTQAADFMHTIATKLKDEQSFTLSIGGKNHEVTPASNVELEVKLEENNGKFEFELELEWHEDDNENGGLSIS